MPITGQVDLSDILSSLGDPEHGLKESGPAENTAEQDEEYIYRATYGQDEMSTSMDLEPAWDLIWDVNGYYLALGIPWPYRATKKELRIAYQERNGQDSEYLTYVLKQLLDPEIRAQYDKRPFGKPLKDKYIVQAEIQRLTTIAAELSEESGTVVTVEDLLDEHPDMIPSITKQEIESLRSDTWSWGFYLLKTRKMDYHSLIEWQKFLTLAFRRRGLVRVISIGYIGGTKDPFVIKTWNGKTIYFLNDEATPSLELAETAVSKTAPSTEGIPVCQHQQSTSLAVETEQPKSL